MGIKKGVAFRVSTAGVLVDSGICSCWMCV